MPINQATPEAVGLHLALSAVNYSQTELAKICGCTQGAVWQMMNKAEPRLSVQYVLKVEAALLIPRWLLRPDYYPSPRSDAPVVSASAEA